MLYDTHFISSFCDTQLDRMSANNFTTGQHKNLHMPHVATCHMPLVAAVNEKKKACSKHHT